jgi:hypothetical protein
MRIARQRVGAFIGRAQRARSTLFREVFAEGLRRPPLRAFFDRVGQLDLIDSRHLMHKGSDSGGILRSRRSGAHLFETER